MEDPESAKSAQSRSGGRDCILLHFSRPLHEPLNARDGGSVFASSSHTRFPNWLYPQLHRILTSHAPCILYHAKPYAPRHIIRRRDQHEMRLRQLIIPLTRRVRAHLRGQNVGWLISTPTSLLHDVTWPYLQGRETVHTSNRSFQLCAWRMANQDYVQV